MVNLGLDKIYVINLPTRYDRRDRFDKLFEGLDFHYINATSGGDLNIPGHRGPAGGGSNYGGDSHMGTGGVNIWVGQLTSDTVTGYGGGSGGGYQLNTPAGGHGVVIVTEYK